MLILDSNPHKLRRTIIINVLDGSEQFFLFLALYFQKKPFQLIFFTVEFRIAHVLLFCSLSHKFDRNYAE